MSKSFDYNRSNPTLVSPYAAVHVLPFWRRALGWIFLLLALLLLIASAALILTAPDPGSSAAAGVVAVASQKSSAAATETETAHETAIPAPPIGAASSEPEELPTLSPERIADLLATPPEAAEEFLVMQNSGHSYDPFTIIPNRSRTKTTTYTVARGDTIDGIANRFGLSRETIAWCNHYRLALVLLPGDVVTIPPTDGACHTVLASQRKDIRDIAKQYSVDDPYVVIDAPANELSDISPETLLPSGKRLFIPGGLGSIITWNAPVEEDSSGNVIAFARGHPNSCGAVAGGGTFWSNPLPNGTYVRGFYAGHSGIDLAAPTGTPVLAANGGPILYAGWNSWGYGNTVVIGHGPISTLYGHMNSLAVRCGNFVAAGQVIGYVGSSGNSSGPHLHFEIRYRNQPQDPAQTLGVGW